MAIRNIVMKNNISFWPLVFDPPDAYLKKKKNKTECRAKAKGWFIMGQYVC